MNKTFANPELRAIAKYHRLVLWSLVAAIAANLVRFQLGDQLIPALVYLLAVSFQIFALYKLGKSLKLPTTTMVLLMLGLFIPVVGLLILLMLHSKAMDAMKAAGVKVGFMGADPDSI